jgi:hypothetical protein
MRCSPSPDILLDEKLQPYLTHFGVMRAVTGKEATEDGVVRISDPVCRFISLVGNRCIISGLQTAQLWREIDCLSVVCGARAIRPSCCNS